MLPFRESQRANPLANSSSQCCVLDNKQGEVDEEDVQKEAERANKEALVLKGLVTPFANVPGME